MKIAIIGPSTQFLSGVSYFTTRLANALSTKVEVEAILFRHMLPARLFPGYRRVGKDLTQLHFDKSVKVHEILDWYDPFSWYKAAKIAASSEFIILEWWTASISHMYLAILLFLRRRVPAIIEYHEVMDPLEQSILPIRLYSRITGRLIRSIAHTYVVHSEVDRKLICKSYGIPHSKVTVIPHGLYDHYRIVDKEKARAILGIKEKNVILFFGLLRPYKGVKYLIEAFNGLPRDIANDTRLFIAGETWEDRESIEMVDYSIYRDKITLFNRYASDEEVSLIFSAADVLVLPYIRASQSGVAHIGMAFGMPIISTDVGGLWESLSPYEGATFVRAGDPEGLRKVMIHTISEERKFEPPEQFKWDCIANKWLTLFRRL